MGSATAPVTASGEWAACTHEVLRPAFCMGASADHEKTGARRTGPGRCACAARGLGGAAPEGGCGCDYFLRVHELHQPAALTALPGNSRHPPCAEPAAPWYSAQLAHLLPGFASVALEASGVYLSALAVGSSVPTSGSSAACAVLKGAAATGINSAPRATFFSSCRRD